MDRTAEFLLKEAERFATEAIAKNPAMESVYRLRLASYRDQLAKPNQRPSQGHSDANPEQR